MKKKKHVILGVHITDRVHNVKKVQELFTKFGCSIKTRLGLHEASDEFCSPNGLVILEMVGDEKEIKKLETGLGKIGGVETKKIVFDHD